MKHKLLTLFAVAASFLGIGGLLFAHHAAAAYSNGETITVQGTTTEFQFVNPHVLIHWDVKDEKGEVQQWQGELTSPNHLVRAGWNRTSIKRGDQIAVTGYRSKNGSNSLRITKVVVNGQPLSTTQGE